VTLFGNEHAKTLRSIDDLAHAYELDGKLDDAIEQYEQALQLSLKKPGADHKDTFRRMNNLGVAYNAAGRSEQARSILEQAYEKEKSQSIDEPVTMSNLALAYKRLGQTERATSLYQEGLANARVTLKMTHPSTQGICQNLADCYDESAQPEKAEPLWRELVEAAKGKSGADSPPYASRLTSLGLNLINQHRAAEAEEILRQALEIRERKDPEAWTTFNTRSILGGALAEQKKYQEAEPLLLSGYEGIKERPAPGPQRLSQAERLQQAVERLVKFYADQEMVEQAEVWRTRLAAQE
jgi:non-specific serine/threonine protein kinase/serine/threonine-protein kinase